jgi:N-acetylglutamate synthase-like GNAT family acetyltransferase
MTEGTRFQFALRAAAAGDFPAIRQLIRQVGINPMSLDWRRFVIAVDANDRLLGCGQLKPHGPQVVELASIAVVPEHRHEGIARAIIEHLLARAPRPLYLMCRSELGPFYERWAFRSLDLPDMPPYFRRMARLARAFAPLAGERGGVLIMELK